MSIKSIHKKDLKKAIVSMRFQLYILEQSMGLLNMAFIKAESEFKQLRNCLRKN